MSPGGFDAQYLGTASSRDSDKAGGTRQFMRSKSTLVKVSSIEHQQDVK